MQILEALTPIITAVILLEILRAISGNRDTKEGILKDLQNQVRNIIRQGEQPPHRCQMAENRPKQLRSRNPKKKRGYTDTKSRKGS